MSIFFLKMPSFSDFIFVFWLRSFEILLKNDRVKNKNSITDATKDDCCHMLRLQVFTFTSPLLFLYERSIPYPIITTEKELILFGSRRLSLTRQNNAEFDGEEDYCCKDPKKIVT